MKKSTLSSERVVLQLNHLHEVTSPNEDHPQSDMETMHQRSFDNLALIEFPSMNSAKAQIILHHHENRRQHSPCHMVLPSIVFRVRLRASHRPATWVWWTTQNDTLYGEFGVSDACPRHDGIPCFCSVRSARHNYRSTAINTSVSIFHSRKLKSVSASNLDQYASSQPKPHVQGCKSPSRACLS